MQVFTVTGLFAGQHNTKLHGTITGVISINKPRQRRTPILTINNYCYKL